MLRVPCRTRRPPLVQKTGPKIGIEVYEVIRIPDAMLAPPLTMAITPSKMRLPKLREGNPTRLEFKMRSLARVIERRRGADPSGTTTAEEDRMVGPIGGAETTAVPSADGRAVVVEAWDG